MKYHLAMLMLATASFVALAGTGSFVPSKEDVPKYLGQLKNSKNAQERAKAADMLGRRGKINIKDVEPAIEPLKLALEKDPDKSVRKAAIEALGSIAPDPETTVPLITNALKDKDYGLRMAAVHALENYGPNAKSALPALRELQKELNDKKNAKIIGAAITAISGKKKKT